MRARRLLLDRIVFLGTNDREEYERRRRETHPEAMWWENLRDHKWLVFALVVAVVVMVVVGLAVN
jgi:hypothetical protein